MDAIYSRTRTTRAQRAQQIVDDGCARPIDAGAGLYRVQSQTQGGVSYDVDLSKPSCTCPDVQHLCKHIQAARIVSAILQRTRQEVG